MNSNTEGTLIFILFIPILWVLWLWVHIFCYQFTGANTFRCPADDCFETGNHLSLLSGFL
jgi:hypothetical protein